MPGHIEHYVVSVCHVRLEARLPVLSLGGYQFHATAGTCVHGFPLAVKMVVGSKALYLPREEASEGFVGVNLAVSHVNTGNLINLSFGQGDFIGLKNITTCDAVTTAKHCNLPKEFYCLSQCWREGRKR